MKNLLKTDWPALALVGISFLLVLGALPFTPEKVAIHWNIHGQADGWGARWTMFLMPATNLFTWVLLIAIPYIDPRLRKHSPEKQENMHNVMRHMRLLFAVFWTYATVLTLLPNVGLRIDLTLGMFTGIFVLFIYLGHYLPKLPTNWFAGYRCPWTLENDEIWKKTHRLGGRMFFWGGLLMLLVQFTTNQAITLWVFVAWIVAVCIIPFAYSFLLWKKLPSEQSASKGQNA